MALNLSKELRSALYYRLNCKNIDDKLKTIMTIASENDLNAVNTVKFLELHIICFENALIRKKKDKANLKIVIKNYRRDTSSIDYLSDFGEDISYIYNKRDTLGLEIDKLSKTIDTLKAKVRILKR